MRAHRPLTCRLNLHHRWRTNHTEDGGRYLRCARCGKDHVPNPSAVTPVM
jgi:hypothetical protein